MPALIVQTIHQDLKILLVAKLSRLSKLLVQQLEDRLGFLVVRVSWAELAQKQAALGQQKWYKIILFLEQPQLEKTPAFLPPFITQSAQVIMPVTTSVGGEKELTKAWSQQVLKEQFVFNRLRKNIGISRFIFYQDLVKIDTYPLKFILSQLQLQLLLDPQVELGLQGARDLIPHLVQVLIKPQSKPKLFSGQKRLSRAYLSKARDLIERIYQLRLTLKEEKVRLRTHPIFLKNTFSVESIKTNLTIDEIIQVLVKSIMSLKQPQAKVLTQALVGFRPPDKKELLKMWNKISQWRQEVKQPETPQQIENQEVNSLFDDYRAQQKTIHLQKLTQQTKKGFFKLQNRRLAFIGGLGVSTLAGGVLLLLGIFLFNLSRFHTKLANSFESQEVTGLARSSRGVEFQLRFFNWLPFPLFTQVNETLEISKLILDLDQQRRDFQTVVFTAYQQLMPQDKQDEGLAGAGWEKVIQQAAVVFKTLALLQAKLKFYPLDKISASQKQALDSFQQQVKAQEKKLGQFQQLAPLLPALLGQGQKQVYALMLQNNQELRPTGGFIQAISLLTFKHGKLISIDTKDVYSLDQQLTGAVKPPADLQKFLGEKHWYLRDANWNPDFPQTAERVGWFIDKSWGVKVDGVMGINLSTLEKFLTILGSVELPEYNEVLTQHNLAERMEFHSEVSLVGQDGKPAYSQVVLARILTQLQTLSSDQVMLYFSSLAEMMDDKELLVSVFDDDLQASFSSLGWTGAIVKPTCPAMFGDGECVVDSIAQIEANVGVNKANYYLERQIDHSVMVLKNKITHKRVVKFKNKAQTNAWPKGPYRAYTRFYLPPRAEITRVLVNQQKPPIGDLVIGQELGRKVVGVLTETKIKAETELLLEYSLPLSQATPFSYVFFDQKQPGARQNSPRIFLSHEPDLEPTLIAPQAEVQGEVIVFNPSQNSGHLFVGVSFE